jgi:glucose-1-phosphate thymidylyltransferase
MAKNGHDSGQEFITSRFVGIIPAAGLGSRLAPFAYPKELLPIIHTGAASKPTVKPVMQFSLDLLRTAGVNNCYVVISNWKFEIARMFEDGANTGVSLSYIIRNTPRGLADAINCVNSWIAERHVCLVLPDVIIQPADALRHACMDLISTNADVVMGVFPTNTPEQLGPVRLSADGNVIEVLDKPTRTNIRNTWGLAVWSPIFTGYLNGLLSTTATTEVALGNVFQHAIDDGLKVRAVYFDRGSFIDLGTTQAISSMIENRPTMLMDSSFIEIPSL